MTEIIGRSFISQAIQEFVQKVAGFDEPFLLLGETGVRKGDYSPQNSRAQPTKKMPPSFPLIAPPSRKL